MIVTASGWDRAQKRQLQIVPKEVYILFLLQLKLFLGRCGSQHSSGTEFVLAADGKSDKAWNRYGTTGQGFCLVTDIPLMAKRLPFLKESSKKCGGKITIFYLFLKPTKEHLLDSRKLTIDRYESRSANFCAVHQAVNLDCTIFPSPWKKHSVFFILSTQGR